MAETAESAVKRSIREILVPHMARQPTTGGFGASGQLDFTCCVGGLYLGIEAKSKFSKYGNKGPTALQWQEIDDIRANHGFAAVIDEDTLQDLKTVVDALACGAVHIARRVSWGTTNRFERPTTQVHDVPAPTARKRTTRRSK